MIVVDVFAQDSPEVSLVEDDHMIETLAPNASDDPFDVGALPRGARCRRNLLDVESRNAPFEVRPVDSILVSQHVTRHRIPRKGIDDLLRGPLCRRMLRDIEMDDAPAKDLRSVGPEPAQEHPKATVQIREPWLFHRALEHGELLPKSEILERQ